MRRTSLVTIGVGCAAAVVVVVTLLTGGGSDDPPRADLASKTYSCSDRGLQQRAQLRRVVASRVEGLQGRPRTTGDCPRGFEAGVEFHLPGTVAGVTGRVRDGLACTDPRTSRSALGRRTTYRCHVDRLWMRVTLDPYLPADDPRGPTVLGSAYLVEPPARG